MSDNPLHVAFVWHMHQPLYKNLIGGETILPWVRLHAIKDYLDMVQFLQDFSNLHQTFNLTPSLLEQFDGLLEPDSQKDKFFELTLKSPQDLTEDEKIFLLQNFFMANWETMIRPIPRYGDLLAKRGRYFSVEGIPTILKRFANQDYLDLQALFNLAWFDPSYREKDTQLKELTRKGKYFSEDDKRLILDKQLEIIRRIIPAYKKMQDDGIIEISTSPFYHPILPLLCDTNIARISCPDVKLPKVHFRHPEDAKSQIDAAIKYYIEKFGRPPRGMWPSEGSVSEGAIDLAIEAGLSWVASDEEILFKSLGKNETDEGLYKPYTIQRKCGEIALIFRDKALSDSIGFVYQGWPTEKAVADLIDRLHAIHETLSKVKTASLVSIILDGENPWEYYPNDGRDFLTALYKILGNDPRLKLVTVSEFLQNYPPASKLEKLYPGSWINANFAIWIGQDEKNLAWEYLAEARKILEGYEKQHPDESSSEKLKRAWKEIYIAEGSDWNWWYGDDHSSANDEEFDKLFRAHISNVYKLLGLKPPEYLSIPIKVKKTKILREPLALLKPVIDGVDTNYFEWINAGLIDASKFGGTMHQAETFIKQMYFGFDLEALYFRFDFSLPAEAEDRQDLTLNLLLMEKGIKIVLPISQKGNVIEYTIFEQKRDGSWIESKKEKSASFNKILELAVKFEDIKSEGGEKLKFLFTIERGGLIIERCPEFGPLQIVLPRADYESQLWTA